MTPLPLAKSLAQELITGQCTLLEVDPQNAVRIFEEIMHAVRAQPALGRSLWHQMLAHQDFGVAGSGHDAVATALLEPEEGHLGEGLEVEDLTDAMHFVLPSLQAWRLLQAFGPDLDT